MSKGETSPGGPQLLQPSGWPAPKGYANGMAADGRLVVTGGGIGWGTNGYFPPDFVAQGRHAPSHIAAILAHGGARAEHLLRPTPDVVDIGEDLSEPKAV